MANKIKKLFVIATLLSSMFLAMTACDVNQFPVSSSSQIDSSDISSSSEEIVSLVRISAISNKEIYQWGEELDITVTAYYSDGTSKEITNYRVSGFNNKTAGEQNITIAYENQKCSLTVIVEKPILVSITAFSNKERYEWGEDLDLTVTADYSDESTIEVTDYQVSGYNSQISGEQTIVISYQGIDFSLKVIVNDPFLVSISATSNKESYEWGEQLDLNVTATYSDNSTVSVTDYEVEGYNPEEPGEQTITITYENQTCSLKVTVNNPVLVRISAVSNKESFEYGEDLDITVTAYYSDNSSVAVTDYQVEGYNAKAPGEQTLTITFEDQTCSLKVVVNDPVLISITAISNKESYEWGEQLDITVMANYSDETSIEVFDYQVEGYNAEETGVQTLLIKYENQSCTLKVTVNERVNRFPVDDFNAFLQLEAIQTAIPSPIGFENWTSTTDVAEDGSKYFVATTNDKGTFGVDSIADQYALTLRNDGWNVEIENNCFTALMPDGDVFISFETNNKVFSLRVESYCEFPTKTIAGTLIASKSGLRSGDRIVLGNISQEFIVTGLEDGYLNTTNCLYTDQGPASIGKNIVRFTLGKEGDNWTLTDMRGRKLGATGANQLVWDEGSTGWTILTSNNSTIIMNATKAYGRLCYNPNDGRVTTYRSVAGTELIYPQIFKLVETDLIYPTSISITGKQEIGKDKSSRLSLEYTPSNANSLNDVIWSSSNEEVATVENGVVRGISIGNATITAKTKSKNSYLEATFDITVKETMLDSWTIMLYICGADLESDSGYASSDISEILSVNNQPDDVNIIMETGGTTRWHTTGIDANALSRYHVENKHFVLDEKLTKVNMGKQSTFESFLNWGLQEYPAENTGVILWNHGGALDGCCFDDSVGSDELLNSETAKAFENVFSENGIDKLEFVGYDCCLMQVQDIAEFNSKYFNYMVASEEAEDASGWDYDTWLDDVYDGQSTETILKAACDGFVASCGLSSDQTLSYLDLSKMNDYFTKFEAMASAIKATAKSNSSVFNSLLNSVKSFGDGWWSSGLDSYGTIDGLDFLNKLGNNSKFTSFQAQINAAKEAYNKLVKYSRVGTGAGQAHGLMIIAASSYGVSYPASETSFVNWRSIFK